MISKSIVQETIEALEDTVDYLKAQNLIDDAARMTTLLNFWRAYVVFIPDDAEANL